MAGYVSFLGMPKGGQASCEEGLAPSVHFPLTQTLSISPSNPESLLPIFFLIRKSSPETTGQKAQASERLSQELQKQEQNNKRTLQ